MYLNENEPGLTGITNWQGAYAPCQIVMPVIYTWHFGQK